MLHRVSEHLRPLSFDTLRWTIIPALARLEMSFEKTLIFSIDTSTSSQRPVKSQISSTVSSPEASAGRITQRAVKDCWGRLHPQAGPLHSHCLEHHGGGRLCLQPQPQVTGLFCPASCGPGRVVAAAIQVRVKWGSLVHLFNKYLCRVHTAPT